MAITFKNCAHCNDCDDLVEEIDRLMNSKEQAGAKGLQTRIDEQVYGCQTPQDTISTHPSCAGHRMVGTWRGHNIGIQDKFNGLMKALKDFDDNDCGDKTTNPRAAEVMAQARALAEKGRNGVVVPPEGYLGPQSMDIPRLTSPIAPSRNNALPRVPPLMNRPLVLPRRRGGGGGVFQIMPDLLQLL
jgi:hypothetical protein